MIENKTYAYANMLDKSKEGIKKEVSIGLAKIAFWFKTNHGIPPEIFEDWIKGLDSDVRVLSFYMNFRNDIPELWN